MKPHTLLRWLPLLGLSLISAPFLLAQDSAIPGMETLAGLSVQQQLYLTWALQGFKYLSEFYSSIRNGGGLKRIFVSFWLGENLPKVVATDYSKELSTPPFPIAKPPIPPAVSP